MIYFRNKGNFEKTFRFLNRSKQINIDSLLNKIGKEGVKALSSATPIDSGKTSESWYYEVEKTKNFYRVCFYNSNVQNGVPIAIILQYGHATGTGGWVEGRDYINPAIQPIFDSFLNEVWKEVNEG